MAIRQSKIKSQAQKRLLFLMDSDHTLCIEDNEKAWIADLREEELQVRTCNELIKIGFIKVVLRDKTSFGTKVYYKISQEGKTYCEKSRNRKKTDGGESF
jgi:hypothetical protein